MGIFSRDDFNYKGYNIFYSNVDKLWHIRHGGRYGLSAGTSPTKDEAKRVVDALVK